MKRFSWLIGLLLICSTQMSYAKDCSPCAEVEECDFCDFNMCDVCYSVYADALFFQVHRSGLAVGKNHHTICPDWDWGYRIGGNAKWKDWDLGLRWTSFDTSTKEHHHHYKLDFDVLDIELGYTWHASCAKLAFRPFIGAKLAWTKEKLHKHGKCEFEGQGLTLGTEARWDLCGFNACDRMIPMSLLTRASFSVLDGKFDTKSSNHECIYVPVYEAFVGLNFGFCDLFCDMDANFAIGYEVQHWGSWREFGGRKDDHRNDDIASLGLGGLVLRFGASF